MGASEPWYTKAFDASYLARYAHRSDEDAAREVRFVIQKLNLPSAARLLDYCCGAGRHSRAFAQAGLHVTGFDLSAQLLSYAVPANTKNSNPFYVRADMRTPPFKAQTFDAVVSLFTSFGYFEKDEENAGVIREASRVLRTGGVYLLDFFNIESLKNCLVSRSEKVVNGKKVIEMRCYSQENGRLEKEICIQEEGGPECHAYTESVRAFTRAELEAMIQLSGLIVENVFGDLQGSAFEASTSPRCVIFARKS